MPAVYLVKTLLEGEPVNPMADIITALTTALSSACTSALSAISTILPVVLPVMASIVIIRLGVKIFKRFTS